MTSSILACFWQSAPLLSLPCLHGKHAPHRSFVLSRESSHFQRFFRVQQTGEDPATRSRLRPSTISKILLVRSGRLSVRQKMGPAAALRRRRRRRAIAGP
ncbi:hypothetical protein N657DRAFT_131451 [Parathielavia appendiculata]|uniref:Uncharacterized protein n=1 Tax=Parathielavia appendiculata TaxID=2587402 RepID=A0AAN6TVH2_9PEZI|nr:hypothetical protein N657DRAFT_131451 [Parathielavia appendiculata]